MKQFQYVKGMLYCNNAGGYGGGFILQEKGKENERKFGCIGYSQYSFDYITSKFPMCSDDFILYALAEDYSTQQKSLLLTPPINSNSIKQRELNVSTSYEFFLHFDDKYIVSYTLTSLRIDFTIYQLNGEVVQKFEFKGPERITRPVISENSHYFVIPTIENTGTFVDSESVTHIFNVYKIKPSKDYLKKSMMEVDVAPVAETHSSPKADLVEIELIDTYKITQEQTELSNDKPIYKPFEFIANDSKDLQFIHIDNKGNCIFIDPERKVFMINKENVWPQFEKVTKKRFPDLYDVGKFKFSQGSFMIKK